MQGARRNSPAAGPLKSSRLDDVLQAGIVDLPGQVLEETFELFPVAIGGWQEFGSGPTRFRRLCDVLEFGAQHPAETFDLAAYPDHVAAFETQADLVDVAKDPGRDRTGAVPQFEAQVTGTVAGGEAILPGTDVSPAEGLPRGQFDHRRAVFLRHLRPSLPLGTS